MSASDPMPEGAAEPGIPAPGERGVAPEAPEPPGPGSTDRLETEWQFDAPDLGPVETWLSENARSGSLRVPPEKVRGMRDTYLDTADLRIYRAGYALRIRKIGAAAEASLKELAPRKGSLAVRREITQPLRSAEEEALFEGEGPVTNRLRLLCREGEASPLALIWTERQVFEISREALFSGASDRAASGEASSGREPPAAGPENAWAAEIVLDRSFTSDSLGRTHRLSRLEIEVPQEDVRAFQPLAERLRAECGLEEARRSKFEWALEANGVRVDKTMSLGAVEIARTMTVGQVADAVLRKHVAAFLWHEPGTRLGDDPEHLHDMRVAARRMRAALRLFRGAYPEGEADLLRGRLGEVGRCLGEVRDLDVQMEQIDELGAGLLTVDSGAVLPLIGVLAREREAARLRMIETLDSPSFAALKLDLVRFAGEGSPASPPAASPVLLFGPREIRAAHRKFMRQARRVAHDSPAPEYHELRIRGKRLRYILEFLGDVYGTPARAQIEILVEVQDLLGLHQDAQVSIEKLHAVASERPASFAPETWTALGELAQAYRARAERLRSELPGLLRRVRGERWRALKRLAKEPAPAAEEAAGVPPREGRPRVDTP